MATWDELTQAQRDQLVAERVMRCPVCGERSNDLLTGKDPCNAQRIIIVKVGYFCGHSWSIVEECKP